MSHRLSWPELWLSLDGRATRRDYWLRFWLAWLGVLFVLQIVLPPDAFVRFMPMEEAVAHPLSMPTPLFWVLAVAINLTAITVSVKRCHDRDRSGWFLLMYFLPVLGQIWLFVELGFLPGTSGPNRFGPDPLG